ncbi:MAG: hypothetical protein Q8909_08930 [Bacteroidota bacterium]|nr:hypothetical protein [Bacteroidota bacterium]
MKKILLIVAAFVFSVSTFAQATNNVALADLLNNGKNYSPISPFAVSQGGIIMIGGNTNYTQVDTWDLSEYNGIEVKLTFPESAIGQYMAVRFVMVGADGNAQSIVKTFTISSESQIVTLDFTADGAGTHKLWAIKMPWDGNILGGFNATVEYLNAVVSFTSGVTTTKAENPDAPVNVYSIAGDLIRKAVKQSEAINGLQPGLYIVNNQKVCVLK